MVEKLKLHCSGLRKNESILAEIKRPMCWLALGVIFLFICLFWGRSYEEIPDSREQQSVYVEGRIVSKEYKSSVYGAYWQVVLKEVKVAFDDKKEKISKKDEEDRKKNADGSSENNVIRNVASLEGKYLCQLDKKEEAIPKIGQRILLSAEYELWEKATNPGQFELKKWYCSQGILGQFRKGRIVKQGENYSLAGEKMWQLRMWLYERLQQELGEKNGSLIGAMLLGEKSGLEEESKSLYQRNGISHVLSISGLHLTLLGMGLFICLRHIFGNNNVVSAGCILIMVFYCIFTGNSISTIRATIMFIISFLAQIGGRSYDSLSALGLSAILQLVFNPYMLNNSSFLLSFLAVMGVTFVSPRLQAVLGVKKKLGKSFCVSLSVALTTLPVLLKDYGTYPWYSILLNLFIVPVMSVVLGFSVLLVFVLLFSAIICYYVEMRTRVIFMEMLKILVVSGIKILLSYMEICCKTFEKLPLQDGYLGSSTVWQIFFYVVLLFLAVGNVWKHSMFCKKMILLSAVMILTMQVEFGTELVMLDVGQGDSIVIRNSNGNIYLADCGSSTVSQVGKYRLLPFLKQKGYGRIQGIFLSHLDQDHMNGIVEILQMAKEERLRIEQLFLPGSVDKLEEDTEKLAELLTLAKANKTKVIYLKQGDKITDGNMQFFCFHPETEAGEKKEPDRNNESMVLFLKYKDCQVLLTGDVEKEGEREIVEYIDSIGLSVNLDVLKVAHHGSKGSSSEVFLKKITPKLSLISCGEDNSYGHPHEETLERLKVSESQVMSTTESGAITLKIGKKIKVYEFKK